MDSTSFFDRDISWLSFNGRVLMEASKANLPLAERIKFLSIYSSNLDEFYRVRIPALLALQRIKPTEESVFGRATSIIQQQQQVYGEIIHQSIRPALQKAGYEFIYGEEIPASLLPVITEYFFTTVAGYLQPVQLTKEVNFFPENNKLYLVVITQPKKPGSAEEVFLINCPCEHLPRFRQEGKYILFLEDIIKSCLRYLFPSREIKGSYNVKITRDAELDLQDEYEEDLAEEIEKQLVKRDMGFATRFLYEPGLPLRHLQRIISIFNLEKAAVVEGGRHHNLKDLADLPVKGEEYFYPPWPAASLPELKDVVLLFDQLSVKDSMIHAPYQSYDTVVRFFNEAAIDEKVEEVYTTMYRVASDSRIVQALISAAKNGKKVSVLVELKARFDEANNIRWAKKMKAAGVKIIYSSNLLKVHAKIALVKRKHREKPLLGLLATGNLNESTARFYTDHILLTSHQPMLEEMLQLFSFLSKRKRPDKNDGLLLNHLLIAQFNMQTSFLALIDREIEHAKKGLPASIIIKLNNLEEEVMIRKLYEASMNGVKIELIIRGICRLVPGKKGQSENISVRRIVDRYLEHGRVFIFHNNGDTQIWMGSADWMNRNIYRRIEVCFPIYDPAIASQVMQLIDLQLADNLQALGIGENLEDIPLMNSAKPVRSQEAIYQLLTINNNSENYG